MLRVSVLLVFICAAFGADIEELRFDPVDDLRARTVPLKVYRVKAAQAQPVIIFSHGLGGSRENSPYLGKHWAAAGYVCVFVQHHGSDELVWKNEAPGKRFAALKKAAGLESFQQRMADIPFVIDQLEQWQADQAHSLYETMDLKRIGMCGHSYGAVTTVAVAGQKYRMDLHFEEPRLSAFFAMSPQPGNIPDQNKSFGHIKKPMLCMTGTKDGSPIDPNLKPSDREKVYAALPEGDAYQLVLKDAEHYAFGDHGSKRTKTRNPKHHPAIQEISLQFWNAYLKDDTTAKAWLKSEQVIPDSGLSDKDQWMFK